jgi:hypothetical protein
MKGEMNKLLQIEWKRNRALNSTIIMTMIVWASVATEQETMKRGWETISLVVRIFSPPFKTERSINAILLSLFPLLLTLPSPTLPVPTLPVVINLFFTEEGNRTK